MSNTVEIFIIATSGFLVGVLVAINMDNIHCNAAQKKTFETGRQDGLSIGREEGYAKARNELQSLAILNCNRTMQYNEKDAKLIKESGVDKIAPAFLEDKVKMSLLPRWNLTLLGDNYIVRRPLRADWNDAWFMTEKYSERIDTDIQDMLKGTSFEIDPTKKEIAKRKIAQAIHDSINEVARSIVQK